jgi:uncharacterized protein (TIRG00374 family)
MRIGNRDYNIKAGLTIFLAISVVSVLAIFFLTADRSTWTSLRRLRLGYGLLAAALMVAQWCFNAIRFRILVNSLGSNVSFVTSLKAFMANLFIAAITPSQTGGGPMQIYVLNRAGVPIAKAFAGCLMGAVLSVFSLLTSTLVILFLRPGFTGELGQHLASVITAASIVFSILAALFLLSIFKIGLVKQLIGGSLLVFTRAFKAERRLAITKRVLGGIDQYRESMSLFAAARKRRVLFALIFTLACVATNSLIAPVLLTGLDVEQDALSVYLAQPILFFIAYFGPTPGASGIAEFSNYWMLSSLDIQPNMLAVYTLLWRFFTSFIGVGVGGFVILLMVTGRRGEKRRGASKAPLP